jgi:C1A family cysteine protease
MDRLHIKGFIDPKIDDTFPPYYDLRNENKLTPVRSQQGFSCWFHATYASLESYLMPEEPRDFDGEILDMHENHGFDLLLGGHYHMSTACLTRWSGPQDDPNIGYNYRTTGIPGGIQKHVQQVVYLPTRAGPQDNNTVKWFIMNYGALYAGIRFEVPYHNYHTHSYYYYKDDVLNHGAALVGWDDHYDRHRFNKTPPGDGAFIARQSWGADWGDGGYFYMSYYDTALDPCAVYNNAEETTNYGTVYQYDPLGSVVSIGGSTTYWAANTFTAVNDRDLEAVSFYTTDVNTRCNIHIYKNTGPGGPTSGVPVSERLSALTYPGYYTVKLTAPVPLHTGDRFSVVIKFVNSSFKFPVAIEKPIENYSSKAAANTGESWVSKDGTDWQDLTVSHPNSSVCIKAFTAGPTIPQAVISCQASRETQKVWIISKLYGVVTFRVENFQAVPLSQVVIYRKVNDENYEAVHEITADQLRDGSCTFIDKYLDAAFQYIYHVTAFDSSGMIIGKSPEQTILPGSQGE